MEKKLIRTDRSSTDIEVRDKSRIGQGWGDLTRYTLRHRRYDGSWSEWLERDLYTIGEVASVIVYDPALDAVLLVEQFRTCGLRYDEATWLFEAIAGMIDKNDSPESCAIREAKEESDCHISSVHRISTLYSSPGGYGERIHLFAAKADLSDIGGIHGLRVEHEDIRVVVVPLEEALTACDDCRIVDSKTIIALNWLARHKQNF